MHGPMNVKLLGLLWTSDQPDAQTTTSKHTMKGDRHQCQRRNSKPQSQQASDRKTTPYTARHHDWLFEHYLREIS